MTRSMAAPVASDVNMARSAAGAFTRPNRRTVVCSPHFDDAVLSCWSVLEREENCTVLNVFTGAPAAGFTAWYDQKSGASSSAGHMQRRALEDRDALSIAGKEPVDLGLLEAQYRLRRTPLLHTMLRRVPPLRAMLRLSVLQPALCGVSPPRPEQLADAIAQAAPDATSVWVPAGIGGHPDHMLTREAGAVLASRGMAVRLYADQPYATQYGWPEWIARGDGERKMDRASAWWARHLASLNLGDAIATATVVRLTSEETARKAAAIHRYATQIRSLCSGRGRVWLTDQDGALGYEVQWELGAGTRPFLSASS
jgi:LmbE family N-acetylglucosaminyl deacetylase